MTEFLLTQKQETCYGCSGCEEICPVGAITFQENDEGFLYPFLDKSKCIECGMCKKVCPYETQSDYQFPIKTFAAQYKKNKQLLLDSSSGGAFIGIANKILDDGGYIVGCVFNKELKAEHILSNNKEEIKRMQGSKYVQSNMGNIYSKIKEKLLLNKKILFSGTPCQVDGLKKYLQKEYENLITIDLICHGVPSPRLLEEFKLSFYQKKGTIEDLKFRDKRKNGWCSQGTIQYRKNKKIKRIKISPYNNSYYYYYYLKNSVSRYSCYTCKYANPKRVSDITIGDYWNIQDILPNINYKDGVSAILINTLKGKKLMENIKNDFNFYETEIEDVIKGNDNLKHPSDKPILRDYLYKFIIEKGYDISEKKYCKYQYFRPLLSDYTPIFIKRILKKILRKG